MVTLVVIAAGVVVWSPLLTPVAQRVLRQVLPLVQVERIGVDGFLTVRLQGARALDEDGVECARVGQAEISVSPSALLDKRIEISRAHLQDVAFDVRSSSSGRLCILSLVPSSAGSSGTSGAFPLAVAADALTIDNAKLRVENAVTFDIEQVALRGGFSDPLAYADIDAIDAVMHAGALQMRVSVMGRASWVVPYDFGDASLLVDAESEGYRLDAVIEALVEHGVIASTLAAGSQGFGKVGVSSLVSIAPELDVLAWVRAPRLDLKPLKLNGHLSAQARGHMHGALAQAEALVDLRGSDFEGRRLDDARFAASLDGERWTLNRAQVLAQGVHVHATGHGTFDSVHGDAQVRFAGPLPVPGVDARVGALSLIASADVTAQRQSFAVRGNVEAAHVAGIVSVDRLSLSAEANGDMSARVDASGVSVDRAPGFSADLHAEAQRKGNALAGSVKASAKRGGVLPADVSLSAQATANLTRLLPSLKGAVAIEARNFALNRELPLTARAHVTLDERLDLDAVAFLSAREAARLSADMPRCVIEDPSHFQWEQPLHARIISKSFPLQTLRDAAPGVPQIDGLVDVDASATGTLLSSRAKVSVSLRNGQSYGVHAQEISVVGSATIDHPLDKVMPVNEAQAQIQVRGIHYGKFDGGSLNVDATLKDGTGDVQVQSRFLNAQAKVSGVPTAAATIDGSATATAFDIALLRAFLPAVRLRGMLNAKARASGKLLAPALAGEVTLRDGFVAYQSFPSVHDVALHATLAGDRVVIDSLTGTGAGHNGKLSATANLSLSSWAPKQARAVLSLDKFMFNLAVLRDAQLTTQVTADLAFEQGIVGKVLLEQGSLQVGSLGAADRELASIGDVQDVHFVQFEDDGTLSSEEGRAQAAETRTHMDIALTAKRVNVRNDKNVLAVTADMRLADTESGIAPRGVISVPDGRIEVLGRLYDVDRARVSLDGNEDVDPALDVLITRQFPRARVNIEVRGTAKKPVLSLSSNPAIYDRAQMLSLIVTGKEEAVSTYGPSQSSQATTEQVAGTVASAVLGPLASTLGKKVGLDIVRIGVDRPGSAQARSRKSFLGENRASLELGKFITDRLYVGARGVLGASDLENSYEARLEYGLTERLRLESSFGDRGVGGLDLMWRFVY